VVGFSFETETAAMFEWVVIAGVIIVIVISNFFYPLVHHIEKLESLAAV